MGWRRVGAGLLIVGGLGAFASGPLRVGAQTVPPPSGQPASSATSGEQVPVTVTAVPTPLPPAAGPAAPPTSGPRNRVPGPADHDYGPPLRPGRASPAEQDPPASTEGPTDPTGTGPPSTDPAEPSPTASVSTAPVASSEAPSDGAAGAGSVLAALASQPTPTAGSVIIGQPASVTAPRAKVTPQAKRLENGVLAEDGAAGGGSAPSDTTGPTATSAAGSSTATGCSTAYAGGCVPTGRGDVDCADVTGPGPLTVVGPADPFGLDRDGDKLACEAGEGDAPDAKALAATGGGATTVLLGTAAVAFGFAWCAAARRPRPQDASAT